METLTLKQCLDQMGIAPEDFIAMIEGAHKKRIAEYALKHNTSIYIAKQLLALEDSCLPVQPAGGEAS